MLYRKHAKKVLGGLFAGVTLATLGLFGIFGTASAVAGDPPPPPPPADPALAFEHVVTVRKVTTRYLAVSNADGSNVADIVTLGSTDVNHISWSPDGHSIAWSNGGIWRVDIALVNGVPVGSNLLQLVSSGASAVDWSPLGDLLVYRGPNISLYTVPATGGPPTLVVGPPATLPKWSPDGTRIAYSTTVDTSRVLRTYELATGITTTILTFTGTHGATSIDWSHSSNLIAFTDGYDYHVVLLDVATGELTHTNAATSSYSGASFSPDDSQLVYVPPIRDLHLGLYDLSSGTTTMLSPSGMWPAFRNNP